eukprot:TRINITY_DN615_c0_g1_i1.p1 TRINITY_DN615_c0_g1~~TRINITY_DN615_c0_g1_i1.p1  ORF type:complete len:729 (-),score=285.05 TRINITY_DN615_c0_g1_i1:109-2295(-)
MNTAQCPICNRFFSTNCINQHANFCIDTTPIPKPAPKLTPIPKLTPKLTPISNNNDNLLDYLINEAQTQSQTQSQSQSQPQPQRLSLQYPSQLQPQLQPQLQNQLQSYYLPVISETGQQAFIQVYPDQFGGFNLPPGYALLQPTNLPKIYSATSQPNNYQVNSTINDPTNFNKNSQSSSSSSFTRIIPESSFTLNSSIPSNSFSTSSTSSTPSVSRATTPLSKPSISSPSLSITSMKSQPKFESNQISNNSQMIRTQQPNVPIPENANFVGSLLYCKQNGLEIQFNRCWIVITKNQLEVYNYGPQYPSSCVLFTKCDLDACTIFDAVNITHQRYSKKLVTRDRIVHIFIASSPKEENELVNALENGNKGIRATTNIIQNNNFNDRNISTRDNRKSNIIPVSSFITPQEARKMDQSLLSRIHKNPDDTKQILLNHFQAILQCKDHPLGGFIPNFLEKFVEIKLLIKLQQLTNPSVYEQNVITGRSPVGPNIEKAQDLINQFRENFLAQITNYYKPISTINGFEACIRASIDCCLYTEITTDLFSLYTARFRLQDQTINQKFNEFQNITLAHLNAKRLFWLEEPSGALMSCNLLIANQPYQKAIECFAKITKAKIPSEKVEILMNTSRLICQCVHTHWQGRIPNQKMLIGGEELVPIFTYVIIKSNIPWPYSESRFIEDNLSDFVAIGEEGYMLATFQACLAYINDMTTEQLEKNLEEMLCAVANEDATN